MENINVEDIRKFYLVKDIKQMFIVYYDKQNNRNVPKNLSLEEGYSKLGEYLKNNKCELGDLLEANKYDVVEDLNELKEQMNEDFNSKKSNKEEEVEELDDEYEEENDEKLSDKVSKKLDNLKIDSLKVKKWAIRVGLLLGGVVVVNGIYKLGKYNGKKNTTTESIETTSIMTPESTTEVEVKSFNSVDDILENANINETKKTAVQAAWSYINFYNDTVASKHLGSDGTRLAHSWEEVMTDYLVYNNITGEEAIKIFDDCKLDANELKNNYSSSIEQDVMGYVVLTEPTFKEDMINSETGKDFYKGYEDMIIRFNKNGDNLEAKEKIANEFYTAVYTDFLNGSTISETESYKLSVIPIIKAFNLLTQDINCELKLSEEDAAKITDIGNGVMVSDYIDSISDYANSYSVDLDEDITYTKIKDLAIEELSDANLYNLDNRNITNSIEYKNMFKKSEQKVRNTSRGYSGSSRTYNESVANSAGMIQETPEQSTSDEIPDWLLNEEDQGNGYNSNQNNNNIDDSVNDEVPVVDEDTPDVKISKANYYDALADMIIENMSKIDSNEITRTTTK